MGNVCVAIVYVILLWGHLTVIMVAVLSGYTRHFSACIVHSFKTQMNHIYTIHDDTGRPPLMKSYLRAYY